MESVLAEKQPQPRGRCPAAQGPSSGRGWRVDAGQSSLSASQNHDPSGLPTAGAATSSPSSLSFSVTGLAAWLGLWDLSSLTRNRTQAPAVKARSPDHRTAGEFPSLFYQNGFLWPFIIIIILFKLHYLD